LSFAIAGFKWNTRNHWSCCWSCLFWSVELDLYSVRALNEGVRIVRLEQIMTGLEESPNIGRWLPRELRRLSFTVRWIVWMLNVLKNLSIRLRLSRLTTNCTSRSLIKFRKRP